MNQNEKERIRKLTTNAIYEEGFEEGRYELARVILIKLRDAQIPEGEIGEIDQIFAYLRSYMPDTGPDSDL